MTHTHNATRRREVVEQDGISNVVRQPSGKLLLNLRYEDDNEPDIQVDITPQSYPSIIEMCDMRFDLRKITHTVFEIVEVKLYDARRAHLAGNRGRTKRHDLVKVGSGIRVRRGEIHDAFKVSDGSTVKVRILRRHWYKGFGNLYYKYEVVG